MVVRPAALSMYKWTLAALCPPVQMHANLQVDVYTNKQTPNSPTLPLLVSFPPNQHLAWYTARNLGSQLSNRCQCMCYSTKGSPITTHMFCFPSSNSLLVPFPPQHPFSLRPSGDDTVLPSSIPHHLHYLMSIYLRAHTYASIQEAKRVWMSVNREGVWWETCVCVCIYRRLGVSTGSTVTGLHIRTKDSSNWRDSS